MKTRYKDNPKLYFKLRYLAKKKSISKKAKIRYLKNRLKILTKSKQYRKNNSILISKRSKLAYNKNKSKYQERNKKYYNKNKQKIKATVSKYRLNNKEKINKRNQLRSKNDLNFRLRLRLRGRIYKVLNGINKSKRTLELIGCSVDFLKQHLEKQFTEGMTWDNYGYYGWHVDHRKPCKLFDLTNSKEQEECFHYTNLQPMWREENLIKGCKY